MEKMATLATNDSALREMEQKVGELPLLPQVLVRFVQLSPDSRGYVEHLRELALEDPPFAVRVLALANSARFAPVAPVTSIESAFARLGTSSISGLLASLSVQRVFVPVKPNQVRLWTHSITAAVAASHIARFAGRLEVDPNQAYLAGLLHDIGRFVMLEHAPEELLAVDNRNWKSPQQLIKTEFDICKFTHSALGHFACKQWGLPNLIAGVVRDHHSPTGAITPGTRKALTFCVALADRVCLSLLENEEFADIPADERRRRLRSECITTANERAMVTPSDLLPHLDAMRQDSQALIKNLGFSQ